MKATSSFNKVNIDELIQRLYSVTYSVKPKEV